MKNIKLFSILIALLMTSACSTHYGAAQIVSNPPGAEVLHEDGTIIGTTPTTAWWREGNSRRKNIVLRFYKDGFYEKTTSFWLSMRHNSLKSAQDNSQLVEVVLDGRNGQ